MQGLSSTAHLYRVDILYQDERMVVVNKPSGLAVHKGWAADPVNVMKLVRRITRKRVNPVHRLDRGTSGVLVMAFDGETAGLLQDLFREKTIRKRYLALTRGITPESGLIDHPVPRKPKGPKVDARTTYRRLGHALDRFSLVEAFPETGRLHQIRKHLKHINHPIIGDTGYGDGKENRRLRSEVGLMRLALHASRITFDHPHTGKPMTIDAPPPDDLRVPLERMGFTKATWE